MNRTVQVLLLALCFCFPGLQGHVSAADDAESILSQVESLKKYVIEKNYKQAMTVIDSLKGQVYDASRNAQKAEISGDTYKNFYYRFQISNPVTEWIIKPLEVKDEIYRKKNRMVMDMVTIENPLSPYGLLEQIVVSVYDIGYSVEGAILEERDFKPSYYLKKLAERTLAQLKVQDSSLVEKSATKFQEFPAYRVVVEMDMGFKKKVRTVYLYVFAPAQKCIFVFSFIMHGENYPVYSAMFDTILSTVRMEQAFEETVTVTKQSFTDIYLAQENKKNE